ncbi:ABC transporter ATP-binding protein [Cytobacillus horneckiae]|uniref:ABC transporter ATP-binding protein n=1 Tax=Cytobacillus horneckiae TaxID=549687 RepID=A0A2N0ZNH8_9BACI|nr:ABC transporter ATP-binding protein [Cytobacillus horneckiae]MBN6889369.1 ABC transporter ATP-binding protein [Cytobacillus horneckiae]MCM3179498.1 ABC transporter ATP-binding protein [Cytobacillus horneckiae]MEC1154924.1 ABC transporter ATP-binding protein [Cytobacillus horneckiae]MED2936170.1 ABC transporter ATP-binding protein [Cytobacillus horneckiae]PKG31036.1 ABC transporter ATP-binding protein [Cytobacillus horneckiae]
MVLLNVKIKSAGYEKDEATIQQVDFSIDKGELIGLIGPNGAGKSTTIKAILGLLEYNSGAIEFMDNASYSYIPERPVFYDELTLWEHLDFVAAVEGLDDQAYQEKANRLLESYKLAEHAHEMPAKYSKGMQQKAMLILAMITEPDVYIIDEPFIGLDPNAMKLFLSSIKAERERGAAILMSTHVLDTAEKVCDRFIIIHKGRLQAEGTLDGIRTQCQLPAGSLYDCFHFIAEGKTDE